MNIDNDENSSHYFGNESTQGRKRPRNSEDFQIKEEDEELYTGGIKTSVEFNF